MRTRAFGLDHETREYHFAFEKEMDTSDSGLNSELVTSDEGFSSDTQQAHPASNTEYGHETPRWEHEPVEDTWYFSDEEPRNLRELQESHAKISRSRCLFTFTLVTILLLTMLLCIIAIGLGAAALIS